MTDTRAQQIVALKHTIRRLKDELLTYGTHDNCSRSDDRFTTRVPCDCGWTQLRKEIRRR